MLEEVTSREFANGKVYMLRTEDKFPLEVTDTFLPYYTKECINEHTNELKDNVIGTRNERWMIGVSCMSGCPVHCEFCCTGQLKRWRNLSAEEIFEQVKFIVELNKKNGWNPIDSKEFKINYTRMGEPFLNIENVKKAIELVNEYLPGVRVHHYISTIGIKGSNFSWIKDNITLQVSLHSLDEERRHKLIPVSNLMSIEELGQIRTESSLKTTVNMTLVDTADFDIAKLIKYFDKDYFFIKLSPINENEVSRANKMGKGIIQGQNII
jgi:23S rRNA (adenine2503-C2)-methyltransferase